MIPVADPADRVVVALLFAAVVVDGVYLLASFTAHMIKTVRPSLPAVIREGLAIAERKINRRNAMRKTYGPEQPREIPEVPFSLRVEHEDPATSERTIRIHDFIGKPDPSSGDYARFSLAGDSPDSSAMMRCLMDILPRMIANNDGVPAQWEYEELPTGARGTGVQAAGGEVGVIVTDLPEREPRFRGPDGQIYPASERKRFEDFDAGSSRRRLYNLMFVDPDARVQMSTVTEIMKDLFAEAAGRPTSA